MNEENIFAMPFSRLYPLYVAKAEKKGRSEAEVKEIICWLCGYSEAQLKEHLQQQTTLRDFFAQAEIHPDSGKVTGTICGVRIEDIQDPLMKQIRIMDKLIDELAKGKPLRQIMRCANKKRYAFDAVIHAASRKGGAYLIFPWDIREEFGCGRVSVHATFDDVPYEGSIVNMGVKDDNGDICYIIGIPKAIRTAIAKDIGDTIHVTIQQKEKL